MNRYFYINAEGKQKGTFTAEELRQEGVKRETLVWTQDMPQWARAEEVEELKYLFSGAPPPQVTVIQEETLPPPPMPKTWLTESILATVIPFICCSSVLSLLGIIGIVYASQVETFYRRGDYDAALSASRSAAKWTRVALWIIFAWIIVLVALFVLLFALVGSIAGMQDWIWT